MKQWIKGFKSASFVVFILLNVTGCQGDNSNLTTDCEFKYGYVVITNYKNGEFHKSIQLESSGVLGFTGFDFMESATSLNRGSIITLSYAKQKLQITSKNRLREILNVSDKCLNEWQNFSKVWNLTKYVKIDN